MGTPGNRSLTEMHSCSPESIGKHACYASLPERYQKHGAFADFWKMINTIRNACIAQTHAVTICRSDSGLLRTKSDAMLPHMRNRFWTAAHKKAMPALPAQNNATQIRASISAKARLRQYWTYAQG